MDPALIVSADFERRYLPVEGLEIRKDSSGAVTVAGYAAVFNQLSVDLGGFQERIEPGAFGDSLKQDDILAYWNHNSDMVLGRSSAKTLRLSEDDHGLAFELELPDTGVGRDAAVSIERRDVRHMSFGFRILKPRVDDAFAVAGGFIIRTLKKVKLLEVSPVGRAAYPQTDVARRSIEAWRKEQEDLEAAAAASSGAAVEVAARKAEMRRRQRLAELG